MNHFKTIAELRNGHKNKFRSSIVPLTTKNNLIESLSEETNIELNETVQKLDFIGAASIISKLHSFKEKTLSKTQRRLLKQSLSYQSKINEYENFIIKLAPECENRIINILEQK